MTKHAVVSEAEWIERRKVILAKEKELTRAHDALAKARREMPWMKVEKDYVFDTPDGKKSLADLFGLRSQLIIYHFMFGPEWKEGCPSCSFVCDHIGPAAPHLSARDVSLVMVSRAPLPKINAFKQRMGWTFPWASSNGSSFNYDFHVSFTEEERATGKVYYNYKKQPFPPAEAPGASVFYKDPETNEVFLTFGVFGRGLDSFVTAYTLLDLVPKGRDEAGLPFDMNWVRHHDRYDTGVLLDPDRPYWPPNSEGSTEPWNNAPAAGGSCCHAEKSK